ncbi:protein TolR [Candidatus Thiosymbion oneisti]|uniref:protein TolR n=1 Tax=Candidatus Thiosymbion oneisti TaxID=589554 RepID=UPI000ABE1675|nr:protein TolR [Candidatus Thiosymbion oneisti]
MRRSRLHRRFMSEINVVPYIDVMLVLLVIFMVTAPLITQGVKVDLPQADAEVISEETSEPVIITVDQFGDLYLDVGEAKNRPVDRETLLARVSTVLKHNPRVPIMIRGDAAVDYGRVVEAMVLAQTAGAPSVGLITTPLERLGP